MVRFARAGETFITLDEEERKLDEEVLLICDAERPVAVGGIMGGLASGVMDDTSDILIECAWFDPVNIRMSSRRLGLVSDSSRRFERGVDPNDVAYVIDLTARLMQETAGGEILRGAVDAYPEPKEPATVSVRPQRVDRVLGMEIPAAEQMNLLRRLQLEVTENGDSYDVKIPTFRYDLEREIDLIEEIIRLHGYGDLPAAVHSLVPLQSWTEELRALGDAMRKLAVRAGLQEVSTYSMINPRQNELTAPDGEQPLRIINPISDDLAVVRTSMLPSLLLTAAYNLNRSNRSIAIFEVGRTFHLEETAYNKTREDHILSVLLTGTAQAKSWDQPERQFNFYDLKGLGELFLTRFDTAELKELPPGDPRFTANCLRLGRGEQVLFAGGDLQRELVAEFDIEQDVCYLEMNLSGLLELYRSGVKAEEISRFPDNRRDLSFLLPEDTAIGKVLETIRRQGGKQLRQVEFFDLYRGEGIEAGWKSASFNLSFNSLSGSLEDEQVDSRIKKIVKTVRQEFNGRLR